MTISLNNDELKSLVVAEVSRLGLNTDYLEITFNRRNQGIVDTTIEILSEPKPTLVEKIESEVAQIESTTEEESDDTESYIK